MNLMARKLFPLVMAALLTLTLVPGAWAGQPLLMATTTSTEDTGLLHDLAPVIAQDTGLELRWTSTGTGKALELGKNCDVDVLLVHAPEAEQAFVAQGLGVNRRLVMYNDFVVLGPAADPAGIKGLGAALALQRLAQAKAVFVSRGDKSGTHQMEISLWKAAGLAAPDKESWYVQAGQGMLQTMRVAEEKKGYTLADRGTFIKYEAEHQGKPPLAILVEGDQGLFNQYSVIEVNRERCPQVKADLARRLADWLVSPRGQQQIGQFKLLGKPLFTPNAQP
jgi:tungstate transport system substrate-binding protein